MGGTVEGAEVVRGGETGELTPALITGEGVVEEKREEEALSASRSRLAFDRHAKTSIN